MLVLLPTLFRLLLIVLRSGFVKISWIITPLVEFTCPPESGKEKLLFPITVIAVGVTEELCITSENVRNSEPVLRSNEKLTSDGFRVLGITFLACWAALSGICTTGLRLISRTVLASTMDK